MTEAIIARTDSYFCPWPKPELTYTERQMQCDSCEYWPSIKYDGATTYFEDGTCKSCGVVHILLDNEAWASLGV